MKNLITVYYKKNHDGKTTLYQNQKRNVASRIFTSKEEAKEFIKNVEVINIYNYMGNKITF